MKKLIFAAALTLLAAPAHAVCTGATPQPGSIAVFQNNSGAQRAAMITEANGSNWDLIAFDTSSTTITFHSNVKQDQTQALANSFAVFSCAAF